MKGSIHIKNATKTYTLFEQDKNMFEKLFAEKKKITALQDISLTLKPGEIIGIIGKNGAGKSTLVKLINGILQPTSGTINTTGKIVEISEVGSELLPELSVHHNIMLQKTLLDVHDPAYEKKILQFSELEAFKHSEVSALSTGMRTKLGLATKLYTDADIFLFDEGFATTDLHFLEIAFQEMERLLINRNKTIIFSTHDMRIVKRYALKIILLEKGRIIKQGTTDNVVNAYLHRMASHQQND